jgi:hypothetical protein
MFGMPILVCALRAEAGPAQFRYAPLFRFARPTQTGTVGQWRSSGKPQASPNALLRRIAPFHAWDFHFISISFAAL